MHLTLLRNELTILARVNGVCISIISTNPLTRFIVTYDIDRNSLLVCVSWLCSQLGRRFRRLKFRLSNFGATQNKIALTDLHDFSTDRNYFFLSTNFPDQPFSIMS